jgi:hypothetical protein
MSYHVNSVLRLCRVSLVVGVFASAGCASLGLGSTALEGGQEVPPAKTSASGKSKIEINDDRTVSGKVSYSGFKGTAAHIHMAAPGKNGPPIVTLKKISDTEFEVPAGTKLTEAQYAAFKAGNLYVNVHSAANPGGEIRGQLKP